MTFDEGYDVCKKEVRKYLKENKLEGIWDNMELELK